MSVMKERERKKKQ